MKTLLLMRHGKSSWKDAKHEEDKLRPLHKKGEKHAQKMSELIEEKKLFPQVILTSTAARARETAIAFLALCCCEITLSALDSLYMAEPPAIVEALKKVPESAERVMVIGHNPGLESLLQMMTGEIDSLPTANVVYLELPIDHWSDLSTEISIKKWEKWEPKDA